jgi:hypothetical protein
VSTPRDFWLSCGHHLLDRDVDGRLPVTQEFLKAYLARPELTPLAESCVAERAIHCALLTNPRTPIESSQLSAIADIDARDNWELMIAWRDYLVGHLTLEAAYLEIVRRGRKFPHLFLNQLVQVILRNVLHDCDDAFMLRAAELFFRPQKLTLDDGALVCADEESVAQRSAATLSPLSSLLGLRTGAEMEVLSESNSHTYWQRSDVFDLALDLTGGRRGLAALGDVIERWISHLLLLDVQVVPVTELRDVAFTWYVGLDSEATRVGDALWAGEDLNEATQARLVGLYQMNFIDSADRDEKISDAPTYLIMAMSQDQRLRLKPQNLLTGLPIRQLDTAQ